MIDFGLLANSLPQLIGGLTNTIFVTVVSFAASLLIGIPLTTARVGNRSVVRKGADAYVYVLRVVPELAVIFWIYYCLPILIGVSLSEMTCGIIALTVVASAYVSEIYRAGYNALSRGQFEAARALGLSDFTAWRLVIYPQIIRKITPSLVNCGVDTMKNSTLLASVGAAELAYEAYQIGNRTYDYITPFTFVAVMFFAIIFPISLFTRVREAKLRLSIR